MFNKQEELKDLIQGLDYYVVQAGKLGPVALPIDFAVNVLTNLISFDKLITKLHEQGLIHIEDGVYQLHRIRKPNRGPG
jgi:hypothetical protein